MLRLSLLLDCVLPLFKNIYLVAFGCFGVELQQAGSFVLSHGLLSSCGVWAAEGMGSVVFSSWVP